MAIHDVMFRGSRLGQFELVDHATPDEIEQARDHWTRVFLEERGWRPETPVAVPQESQRTRPNDTELRCGLCGTIVKRVEFETHMNGPAGCAAQFGIDVDS